MLRIVLQSEGESGPDLSSTQWFRPLLPRLLSLRLGYLLLPHALIELLDLRVVVENDLDYSL